MSLILGCIDADTERRARTVRSFEARAAKMGGLRSGTFSTGDLTVAWGAHPTAPLDSAKSADGRAAVAFGAIADARDKNTPAAKYLLDLAECSGPSEISGLNGYYFALLKERDGSVWLGTDILGYYPLYWWSQGDVLVFASAPGLIRDHPLVSTEPSAIGIAGVLLTMHLVDNQTIWKGVRRLPAGSLLKWNPAHGAELQRARRLEPSTQYHGLTREQSLDLLHEAMAQTMASAAKGRVSVMLSGGLDSRLLAAYAAQTATAEPTCVTFGRQGDYEVHCARAVTRALRLPHEVIAEDFSTFADYAEFECELERSSNSFVDLGWWIGTKIFARLGRPVLTGFAGNVAMGTDLSNKAWNPETKQYEFDCLWKGIRRYGLPENDVRRLLGRDFFGDAVDEVKAIAKDTFDRLPGEMWQKEHMFELLHRQRYHTSPCTWRLSLAVWAEMPYIDLRLLKIVQGLPRPLIDGRVIQRGLLTRFFPALARLPIDTNSPHMRPITASLPGRAMAKIYGSPLVSKLFFGGRERRTYYRLFDINNAGWSAVRARAEPARNQLTRWFERNALDGLLPPPGIRIDHPDVIINGAGTKTLLGMALSLCGSSNQQSS